MDNALLVQLSAYADGELNAVERSAVEQQLAQCPELARNLALYKRLDWAVANIPQSQAVWAGEFSPADANVALESKYLKAIAALPAPMISPEKFDRVWQKIAQRTTATAPIVSAERWQDVWQDIQNQIKKAAFAQAASRPVVAVNFQRSRRHAWRWIIAASAAAVLALIVRFPHSTPSMDKLVALEIPDEPNDASYQVRVKFIKGQREPLVIFYRQEEPSPVPETTSEEPQRTQR
ncbi:MAG: zf-HC2 domain-containing protein [Planctomycetota bacterium]